MKRELIYDLLRGTLSEGDVSGIGNFEEVSWMEWDQAFKVLSMHGLASFAYGAVERMPVGVRPPKDVLLKFIGADIAAQKAYAKSRSIVDAIGVEMMSSDVKCLLLKGLSLAEYYPKPHMRKSVDIDLYAPGAEAEVDETFRRKGAEVDVSFYRHSHMSVSGVLVENHHFLLDVRGRENIAALDSDLKRMALKRLSTESNPGIYYPDAAFSLIFNLHHAMSHFIYEGISFKFLTDWVLFLRKEADMLKDNDMGRLLAEHGLLKFAAVMSEVSASHLGLAPDDIPEYIRREMALLKPRVVERFIDDLFRPYEQIHHRSIIAERLHSVRRIMKAAWKPKEFLGQSAVGFVWDKFVPIMKGQKFEAD